MTLQPEACQRRRWVRLSYRERIRCKRAGEKGEVISTCQVGVASGRHPQFVLRRWWTYDLALANSYKQTVTERDKCPEPSSSRQAAPKSIA
ncbi:metallophosphoesterase [Anopheles sinensis]|uniref:Metallophosphoesterase n=1 Tax=Anopheles sinensis TaxID=74873 RepID=A0A084VE68_ANOSI|nr:metallophosphoesterase [Anopheles sinensis]